MKGCSFMHQDFLIFVLPGPLMCSYWGQLKLLELLFDSGGQSWTQALENIRTKIFIANYIQVSCIKSFSGQTTLLEELYGGEKQQGGVILWCVIFIICFSTTHMLHIYKVQVVVCVEKKTKTLKIFIVFCLGNGARSTPCGKTENDCSHFFFPSLKLKTFSRSHKSLVKCLFKAYLIYSVSLSFTFTVLH